MFPFGSFNGLGIVDGDRFAGPSLGGTLAVKFNTVAYTDSTAKQLFTLPKGAIPILWIRNIVTAFNDTGTDLLDIGKVGSAAAFANDLDVSAVGQGVTGVVPAALFTELTEDTIVTATFTGENADASAGSAIVGCIYMQR